MSFQQFLSKRLPKPLKQLFVQTRATAKYKQAFGNIPGVLNGMVAYNELGGYFTPVNSNHRPVVQEILKGRIHERETLNYIKTHCGEGDVVHAGTYFGDFLPGLSRFIASGSIVWAFEPNPENFRCASITKAINNLQNVKLTQCGLGNKDAEVELLTKSEKGENLGGGSTFDNSTSSSDRIELVRVRRLDDMIPKERWVSIVHLDVEGYEKEALSGGWSTLKRCKPILILEDNNRIVNTEWFASKFGSLGYKKVMRINGNIVLHAE